MSKDDDWFRWERQSALLPMFVVLEASERQFFDYTKVRWPSSVLIFEGPLLTWRMDTKEFAALGGKLADKILKAGGPEKLFADIDRASGELDEAFAKVTHENLSKKAEKELSGLFSLLLARYQYLYALGAYIEPVATYIEAELSKKVKDKELLSAITAATFTSFSKQEHEELLKIAAKSVNGADVSKDIDAHAAQYFWMENNYFETKILPIAHFEKRIQELAKERPEDALKKMKMADADARRKKQQAILKAGLEGDEKYLVLVRLLSQFGWFQDYRKEKIMQANHCIDVLLSEVSRRTGIPLMQLKYSLPNEFEEILAGKITRDALEVRMRNCIFVWEEGKAAFEFETGEQARKTEEKIFGKSKIEFTGELSGMGACKGHAIGIAFVTNDAKEAARMPKGHILISAMTSPDFVMAMKRAGAIVTDWGGTTCHAAIVSREFGIPCIVGTNKASKVFKSGELVEVDADKGIIRLAKASK